MQTKRPSNTTENDFKSSFQTMTNIFKSDDFYLKPEVRNRDHLPVIIKFTAEAEKELKKKISRTESNTLKGLMNNIQILKNMIMVSKLFKNNTFDPNEMTLVDESAAETVRCPLRVNLITSVLSLYEGLFNFKKVKELLKKDAEEMKKAGFSSQELNVKLEELEIVNYIKTAFNTKFNDKMNWFIHREKDSFYAQGSQFFKKLDEAKLYISKLNKIGIKDAFCKRITKEDGTLTFSIRIPNPDLKKYQKNKAAAEKEKEKEVGDKADNKNSSPGLS